MKEVEVIVDGAKCSCILGSKSGKLSVISQMRVFCNGGNKLIATDQDKSFFSLSFGNCKAKNNSPCMPNIEWNNVYQNINIAGSLKILTMNSVGICNVGGGIIRYSSSGQDEKVNATKIKQKESEISKAENPLTSVGVSPTETSNEIFKPHTYPNSSSIIKQPAGENCSFNVEKNNCVTWKIRDENLKVIRTQKDEKGLINVSFPHPGKKYIIEGCDNSPKTNNIDKNKNPSKKILLVESCENEIYLQSNKNKCVTYEKILITPKYLFDDKKTITEQLQYIVYKDGLEVMDPLLVIQTPRFGGTEFQFLKNGEYIITGSYGRTTVHKTDVIKVSDLRILEATGGKKHEACINESLENPCFLSATWKDQADKVVKKIGRGDKVKVTCEMKGVVGLNLTFKLFQKKREKNIEIFKLDKLMDKNSITLNVSDFLIRNCKNLSDGDSFYWDIKIKDSKLIFDWKSNPKPSILFSSKETIKTLNFSSDPNCTKRINSAFYGSTIYAKVLTQNMSGFSIRLKIRKKNSQIWKFDEDLYCETKIIDKYGVAIFTIKTSEKWENSENNLYVSFVEVKSRGILNWEEQVDTKNLQFIKLIPKSEKVNGGTSKTVVNQVKKGIDPQNLPKPKCFCNRDFTVEDMKSLVKAVKGREEIWEKNICKLDNESFKLLTKNINVSFRKYGINNCIQKIAILAETSVDSLFFSTAENLSYDSPWAWNKYKGRGMIHIKGYKDEMGIEQPGDYALYQEEVRHYNLVDNPELIAKKIFLAIDSGCWYFTHKRCPSFDDDSKSPPKFIETVFLTPYPWQKGYFKETANLNLNEIALLMIDQEEKYFSIISKLCQGYQESDLLKNLPDPKFEDKLKNLQVIKSWFNYDAEICKQKEKPDPQSNKRAPWMEVAVNEAKIYGGSKEYEISDRVSMYHLKGGGISLKCDTPWCASFATWCYTSSTELKYKTFSSQFYLHYDKFERCEPFYGALAVFTDSNPTFGHVGFVYGKVGKMYGILGGNQSDSIKVSKYRCGNIDSLELDGKKKFRGFYKPKFYKIKESDKLNVNDEYVDFEDINRLLKEKINENEKNSTR